MGPTPQFTLTSSSNQPIWTSSTQLFTRTSSGQQFAPVNSSLRSYRRVLPFSSQRRWMSAAQIDDPSQNQVVQSKESIQLAQIRRWTSATLISDPSQNQVVQPKESIQLAQIRRWTSATLIDDPSQKQVVQPKESIQLAQIRQWALKLTTST